MYAILISKPYQDVINFMEGTKYDWPVAQIAKHAKVSRTVVYTMIKKKILIKTRMKLYKIITSDD